MRNESGHLKDMIDYLSRVHLPVGARDAAAIDGALEGALEGAWDGAWLGAFERWLAFGTCSSAAAES